MIRALSRSTAAVVLASSVALAACGGNTGGFAPSPKPFDPAAADIEKARDPKFGALTKAVQDQRRLAKELSDFRARFGEAGLDEAAGKTYKSLFGKTADAGQKVAEIMNAAQWEGEDKRIVDLIMSLSDDQINRLVKGESAPKAP
jgi:uncharacterized protein YyaL (SSP411 family)